MNLLNPNEDRGPDQPALKAGASVHGSIGARRLADTTPEEHGLRGEIIPDQKTIVAALVEVARAAWQLADNTEERDNEQYLCDPGDFSKLSAMLEILDQWPDPCGEAATGPRKAEHWYELGGMVNTRPDKPRAEPPPR